MIPVNASITARFGIAGLKHALDYLGYYGGPVRPPLLPLTNPEREILENILTEGGLVPDQ
jgi:4-hydroxy-2-oxoglutarate aldolase